MIKTTLFLRGSLPEFLGLMLLNAASITPGEDFRGFCWPGPSIYPDFCSLEARDEWAKLFDFKVEMGGMTMTLEDEHLEAKNHPIERENHLNQTSHFWVLY